MTQVAIYGFDQDFVTIAGTIASEIQSGRRFNGDIRNSSAANSDSWKYTRYFPKSGVYKVRLIYTSASGSPKLDIGLDSSSNNIFSQLDEYSASTVVDKIQETIMNISRGYHTITILVNGKNGSSAGYTGNYEALQFDLIAESPQYQEDQPPIGQEGQTVLLAKHTAAIAESSWLANLANVDFNKYSEIIIEINGVQTLNGGQNLQMIINGLTSANYDNIVNAVSTSITTTRSQNDSLAKLCTSASLNGQRSFCGRVVLKIENAGNNNMGGRSDFNIPHGTFMEFNYFGFLAAVGTILSSLKVQMDTSTWTVGTTIDIYGVKRV